MIDKKAALSYDDVLLVPQYSDIRSRSEIDIGTSLGKGLNLKLPIFSSPMDTISEKAWPIQWQQQVAVQLYTATIP